MAFDVSNHGHGNLNVRLLSVYGRRTKRDGVVGEFPDGAYPRHVHQINARRRESYVISTAPNKESDEKQGLVILDDFP